MTILAFSQRWDKELGKEDSGNEPDIYELAYQRKSNRGFRGLNLPGFKCLSEAWEEDATDTNPETIIPCIAWEQRITLFAAREKAGKSTFVGAAVAAVTNGGEFLAGKCKEGDVVWIGPEEHESDLKLRWKRDWKADMDMILYSSRNQWLEDPIQSILLTVEATNPTLVVIDTLWAIASRYVKDENKSAEWTPIKDMLEKIVREHKSSVLILAHTTKAHDHRVMEYRGSSAIGGMSDANFKMWPTLKKDGTKTNIRNVEVGGRNTLGAMDFKYNMVGVKPYIGFELWSNMEERAKAVQEEERQQKVAEELRRMAKK